MKMIKVISGLLNIFLAIFILHSVTKQNTVKSLDLEKLSAMRIERIMDASPENVNIVMLGNSITQNGKDWGEKLGRNDVRNSGQGGYTTGQMIWHLDTVAIKANPKYCFTLGGVNDLSCGVQVEQINKNYQIILERLVEAGIQPVVQSTLYQKGNTEGNKKIDQVNAFLENYCKTQQIQYLDLNKYLSNENGLIPKYTRDGTHLTDAGYSVWVRILKKFLKNQNG